MDSDMDTEVRGDELNEDDLRAFRRAAGERGAEAVVTWRGRPHLVREHHGKGEEERFVLEPIPRPFG